MSMVQELTKLRLPVIAAPMFLVSGPELVIAACRSGIVGTFPCLNARESQDFEHWLEQIESALGRAGGASSAGLPAIYGVNLISHQSNSRFQTDLEIIGKHQVPLVITSLGHPGSVVEAVHSYGGMVFHDVTTARHARKAISSGVDGIIAVGSGAGGHAGTQNIISLIREIREFWDGILIAGGAIGDGFSIRAMEILGANFAYVGTRFVATQESLAPQEYKQMLINSGAQDIVYTDRISGVNANFLKPSLERLGIDLTKGVSDATFAHSAGDAKAWKHIWSAGHGVANIHDIPSVSQLVERFIDEYAQACQLPQWGRSHNHLGLSKVPLASLSELNQQLQL